MTAAPCSRVAWPSSVGGSYAAVQLGYGLRLGSLGAAATRRNPTPRYSLEPDERDPDTTLSVE